MKQWETRAEIQENPVKEILLARGIEDVESFLNPKLEDLYRPEYNPFGLKDMAVGVSRIVQAIERKEKIHIAGDYDADGITSTSTLVMGLEDLKADVSYSVPKRSEGYGLSKQKIKECADNGVTLIITCDNGITLVEEVEYAKSLGIDIVITDHHEPQGKIPQAFAVINPKQKDCSYPTKDLCGAGVALKLLQALNETMYGDIRYPEHYLDIVAIGTIADMMKLTGENRIIVKFGLKMLSRTKNKGLRELLHVLSLDEKEEINSTHVGFTIAPTLNAVGRLKDAAEAVEMLLTNSRRMAFRTAKSLHETNLERRKLTEEWTKKVVSFIESTHHKDQRIMIIPFKEDIPEGLIGLIAGKLKEKYARPVILLGPSHKDPNILVGSGRSIPSYDIFSEIMQYKHLTEKFGGHPGACGMSIHESNVQELTDLLNENCTLTEEDTQPTLYIDYEIEAEHVTKSFVEDLQKMEPFGMGNEKPLFVLRDAKPTRVQILKDKHLKFTATVLNHELDAIGFSMREKWNALKNPESVDIAFYPTLNVWQNRSRVQLEIKDLRAAE